VEESEIDRVPIELEQLLADEPRRTSMARAAAAAGLPDAARLIAAALREAAA
jgi:UDP-N-acetylglucosamine:LPS N-acetylglucosamine transferase